MKKAGGSSASTWMAVTDRRVIRDSKAGGLKDGCVRKRLETETCLR